MGHPPGLLPARLSPQPVARPARLAKWEVLTMAVDTFLAYVGVYDDTAGADADYEAVKDLHTKAGLIDAYDAAVIERRADGKVRITKKHETPTRAGGVLGAGVGLATGLVVALFPFAAIGGVLLAVTTGAARWWVRWPVTQRPG
jgi:hypothetical protein